MEFIKSHISNKNKSNGETASYKGGGGSFGGGISGSFLPAQSTTEGYFIVDYPVRFKGSVISEKEITAYATGNTPSSGTTVSNLYELGDVKLTNLKDSQYIRFNATTQKWENVDGGTEGGGQAQTVDWRDILNKPTEFNPQAHQHTCNDITDIATTYVNNINFQMHKGSTSIHTNADEKKVWNDAATAIDQHTGDQDAHCNFDLKEKWDTTSSEFDIHKADTNIHHTHSNKSVLDKLTPALYSKLTQLLDKIIINPDGTIKFKTDISSTGEITAYNI